MPQSKELQRALLSNENCTCENNGDYCESCYEIIERFERPASTPFSLMGKTYFYATALRVANELQDQYGKLGYTFHPTPQSESRIYSRVQVYGPDALGFLGYY